MAALFDEVPVRPFRRLSQGKQQASAIALSDRGAVTLLFEINDINPTENRSVGGSIPPLGTISFLNILRDSAGSAHSSA